MSDTSNNSSGANLQSGSRMDWARLDALADEDINTSDIPALTEEDFARSQWRFPSSEQSEAAVTSHAVAVEVIVDQDTLRLYAAAHRATA